MTSATDRWTLPAFAALGGLVAVRLVAGFQFHAAAVVAPLLAAALGLSYTEIGTLIGAYVLPAVLLSVPGGLLAQRYGDRRVLIGALALSALGGALTAVADGLPALLAGRIVSGAGGALVQIIVLKMATDRFTGPRMSTATATALTAWPLGIALALAVLGAVAESGGWRLALGVSAAWPLASLLFVLMAPRLFPESRRVEPVGPRGFAGAGFAGLKPAALISLAWLIFNAGFSGFVAFAPTWLAGTGLPLDRAGAAASLTGWALVCAQPWGGWLVERVGRASLVLSTGAVLTALATWGTLATGGWEPMFVIAGIVMGAGPGVLGSRLAMSARIEQRALAFALFATGSGAGSMLGPSLAGAVADLTGSPAASIVLAGALQVLALAPWFVAMRGMRRSAIGR